MRPRRRLMRSVNRTHSAALATKRPLSSSPQPAVVNPSALSRRMVRRLEPLIRAGRSFQRTGRRFLQMLMRTSQSIETTRLSCIRFPESEPDTAYSLDDRNQPGQIDLRPQMIYVHVDDVRLRVEELVPDAFDDDGFANRSWRSHHYHFEQGELPFVG